MGWFRLQLFINLMSVFEFTQNLKRSPNTAFTIRTGISSKAVSSYAGIYLLDIPAHWAFYRRYWSDIPAS
jgi:hypothetical protein